MFAALAEQTEGSDLMRTRVKVAFVIWLAIMTALHYAVKPFVAIFGAFGTIACIVAMYFTARYFERPRA
jgi:hypothetical protein